MNERGQAAWYRRLVADLSRAPDDVPAPDDMSDPRQFRAFRRSLTPPQKGTLLTTLNKWEATMHAALTSDIAARFLQAVRKAQQEMARERST